MTIEFLTDDNPLYVLPFFESFLKNYAGEFKVSQISLCRPMGKRSRVQLLKRLTALYGMLGIVRLSARIIRARLCGLLPLGTGAARFHTLAQLCRAYGVRCEKVADPNDNAFLDGMAARQSDLLVSVACPYILKAKVLKMPCMGCINIHHSKLPKYRGMMPTFWQLFHGEKSVGITVHTMAEKIDDGRALLQEEMMVEPGECLD